MRKPFPVSALKAIAMRVVDSPVNMLNSATWRFARTSRHSLASTALIGESNCLAKRQASNWSKARIQASLDEPPSRGRQGRGGGLSETASAVTPFPYRGKASPAAFKVEPRRPREEAGRPRDSAHRKPSTLEPQEGAWVSWGPAKSAGGANTDSAQKGSGTHEVRRTEGQNGGNPERLSSPRAPGQRRAAPSTGADFAASSTRRAKARPSEDTAGSSGAYSAGGSGFYWDLPEEGTQGSWGQDLRSSSGLQRSQAGAQPPSSRAGIGSQGDRLHPQGPDKRAPGHERPNQAAFTKLSQELNVLPSQAQAAHRSAGQSADSDPLRPAADNADEDAFWAFGPTSDRATGQASNPAAGQAERDDGIALAGPQGGARGARGSRAQPETRDGGGYAAADVAAQRQLQLVQGFVDDLSRLHHAACRLKVSRFDSVLVRLALLKRRCDPAVQVNTATAMHRLASAVTHPALSPAVRSELQYVDLVQRLLGTAGSQVKEFKIASISPLVWSLATLRYPVDDDLLNALAERVVVRLREPPAVEPEFLCPLLWACAKLGRSPLDSSLFDAAVKTVQPLLDTFNLRNLSILAWAVATLEHPVEVPFLRDLVTAATQKLDEAGASKQSISVLLWSLARLQYVPRQGAHFPDTQFFERSAELVMQGLHTCQPQQLANVAWALARLRVSPLNGRLVGAILQEASDNPARFSMQNVSNIALAAAILQVPVTPHVMEPLIQTMLARAANHCQEICNMCWSLVALDVLEGPTLTGAGGAARELRLLEGLTDAQAHQLLLAEECCPDALPRDVHLKAWRVMNARTMDQHISSLHEEVVRFLRQLQITHTVEGATPDGLLSIDVIIPRPGRTPVAVEVDGPLHFTALPPYRPLGHTALRDRFLQRRGFVFLGVPFFEWSMLGSPDRKRAFLLNRLEAAGVTIPVIAPMDHFP